MLQAIAVALLILYAAIAWVILRGYRNTRNIGFLIIGCGVLVWPLVSSLLMRILTDSILYSSINERTAIVDSHILPGNLWVQLLLARTGNVIQAGLILIALIAIERSVNSIRIAGDHRYTASNSNLT